jgi:hypothetical protein
VSRPWPELEHAHGRAQFDTKYGLGRSRCDEADKRWDRAHRTAYHGTEALAIAGHQLAQGMHWDVGAHRRGARLTTATEVWKVGAGRAYVNVYPDAYVRKTRRSTARRVWPRP